MHQIVQRLGLRPRPYWGSSQRSPNPKGRGKEGKGRGRKGTGRGGKGNERRLPPLKFKSRYAPLVCV